MDSRVLPLLKYLKAWFEPYKDWPDDKRLCVTIAPRVELSVGEFRAALAALCEMEQQYQPPQPGEWARRLAEEICELERKAHAEAIKLFARGKSANVAFTKEQVAALIARAAAPLREENERLQAENGLLRELVEGAYHEGMEEGQFDCERSGLDPFPGWDQSEAKRALAELSALAEQKEPGA